MYKRGVFASALLFVHLVSFAAYVGAGFSQNQLLKRSSGAPASVRDAYESLAASVVTKIELPAIFGSILSGLGFIAQNGTLMKLGWVHGKLTCVFLLVVLSHLEMFNARKIVKARASGGDAAEGEIAARKRRHGTMNAVGTGLVVAILVLVTFVRLGGL